jgi:murein DD-endopeptidase MepM/ murein hydrolase activator NlpD
MRTLIRTRAALLGTVVVLLAGCQAGPDGGPGSGPPASPTGRATPIPTPTPAAKKVTYTFPVDARTSFGRTHHDYPATDVFAPCGAPVLAPVAGEITQVSRTDRYDRRTDDGAERGGLSFTLIGVDGVRYYGSHLRSLRGSTRPGARIGGGDEIGRVGDTGSAAGTGCHLHFGISPACGSTDWWTRRGVVRPYRFLTAWRAGEQLSPVAAVREWKAEHGCPAAATTDP